MILLSKFVENMRLRLPAYVNSQGSTEGWSKMEPHKLAGAIDRLAAEHQHGFKWRTSLPELLLVAGLPYENETRMTLAQELGYSGTIDDEPARDSWVLSKALHALAAAAGYRLGDRMPDFLLDDGGVLCT